MAVWCLKILVDTLWYFAVMGPLFAIWYPWITKFGCLLPVIYVVYILIRKRKSGILEEQKSVFLWQCKILAGMTFVEMAFSSVENWERYAAVWAFLFFAFGVLMLRITRLGEEYRKNIRFWVWNGVYVVGVLFLAAALTSEVVTQAALWIVRNIYFKLIVPFLMAILYVVAGAANLVVWVLKQIFPPEIANQMQEVVMPAVGGGTQMTEEAEEVAGLPVPLQTFAWILAAAAVVLIVWYFSRKLLEEVSERRRRPQTGTVVKSSLERPDTVFKKKGKITKQQEGIRLVYQKFLRLCRKQGVEIAASDTSRRIQEKAQSIWEEEKTGRLRELYLKARYSEQQIQEGEIEQAKKEYQKLKKESAQL